MSGSLQILHIEDSEADARLIERSLQQYGLAFRCHRVDSDAQFGEAIAGGPWDLVLSDFTVPQMDFDRTLGLIQSRLPDAPIIVLSGTITVERAVSLLKRGVSDFVLKDSLVRLGPAVDRALRETADCLARRSAEATLRLRSAALASASQAVVITDVHGTIKWVNAAFTTVTGFTFDEAVGRIPGELLASGQHDAAFYADFWSTLLAGRVWRGVMINRRKNGEEYPEDQVVSPVRDEAGTLTHFVNLKRDLTDERRMQAQLSQAQKMESIGLLAGGIAHDFNNLITAINATAELAALNLRGDDPVRHDLDRIRETGDRAATLTRQLLSFSRRHVLEPVSLDMNAVVQGMQDLLSRLIGEDIALVVRAAPEAAWVLADRGQLEQVILNLVVNARDAMPDGGTLTLSVEGVALAEAMVTAAGAAVKPGPHVRLEVRDTGTGMDEATRLRMFEPFFTTKGVGQGTGLGLATVYGIVAQSGGCIAVRSAPGKGTTFAIDLPRVAVGPAAAEIQESAGASHGTETILLVEDEDFLRDLARRMLEMAGYAVITAADGERALSLVDASDRPVDLVLTDVVMPGMSGRELAVKLAARAAQVKVLYTSGYTEDVILRKGLADESTHFLRKPYTMGDLTRAVRKVLDS